QLQGVIHAAGLTHDAFIMKKQSKEIEQVLAPKIQGTLNLHQATLNEPLDFFVLFSSVASIFGNAGQSDYAYANAFLDDFAQVREQDRQAGKCFGKTLSINWPLWEEGGITVAAEYQQTLERQLGIVSLTTAEGLTAFVAALNSDLAQCIVLPGRQTKLKQSLREAAQIKNHKVPKIVNVDPQLREQISQLLTQTIAATLKIAPEKLDKQVSFEHYGIDSLMIIQLNQALEKEFKDLPKTLFFEYQNLADLIDYFVSEHAPTFKPISTPTLVMNNQDIAIIGIDGRYPEAENLAQFWENLKIGKDCIREIPAERWDWTHYFSTQKASGKTYSKWGGFLKHVDHFDPLFFNISPSEAALMDPQERLFLQTAWNTIEDAGLSRTQLAGQKVGVYVGVMYGQYQLFAQDHAFVPTNSVYASIANRVSYFFDFHGPSMALDTMCSSSLTAIHLACKSIQNGECQLALAGGVNLCLHPNKYLLLSEGSFLASDGHCRSFGEGGDGYVPGEGVGAVLLKPLAQALADGDRIYAVIKGSQLNHGGKTNGYTVPNPNAQAQLIASTYQQAQVNPAELSYLEAHGTGTSLGDPIEIAGLNKAFAAHGLQHCAIGSVKANIGHCESAAGIAAVTKVVLQLQHKMLVPSIGSDTLNRNIQWEQTPFKVQQQLSPWQGTRISGISSFGAGGANAHLILSEAPNNVKPYANKSHYLCTLSAKTDWALAQKKRDLVQWIKQNPQAHLESVSYTLNAGRTHFPQRAAWVVSSLTELLEQLESNQQLFAETSLNQLAQAYLAGQDLDWQQLHAQEAKIKIALPTYPFAKESYWFNQLEEEIIENELTSVTSPLNDKLEAYLTRQVVQLLKVKAHQLDPSKNLGEYGMDSVHFVELAQSIAKEYQIDFTPAVFYTSSSIRTISQTLAEQYGEAVAKVHQTAFSLPMVTQIAHKKFAIPSEMNEAIAIIGIQGTFPQSADVHQFWENLSANKDLVSEVPADRWDWRQYYGTGPHQSNTKWGGFIAEMDQFDAAFFNISAREAHLMDPQQRLFLQSVWQSIEDAGYNPLDLSGKKVAVFAGVEFNEYQTLIAKQGTEHHGFIATGSSHSMIANRVSYFFNFHGPSEAIDTACSSSLVAIHRAMQALRQGECELAIAGGISLMLDPETTVVTSQLGALSAEGRCKTFDKSANGYVKGEGVGSLLLKPLKQAQRDGDSIYAVIRGSAVNHGGKAQSLTAPNAAMQAELLLSAYTQAQIPPESISYIEAHGTGTALGDPVEIEGLKLAFKTLLGSQYEQSRIGLGSVKTNIGHLEPASGIAGVIKLLLAMTHETLPAIQHLQELNPFINLENSPFYIVKEKQAWQRQQEKPLRAGVSSFGFGGTNAHVVLEEGRPHQQLKTEQQLRPYYLITLSAKQAESLEQKIKDLLQWLPTQDNLCLASLSYTLNQGRAHFAYRCALVVSSIAELIQALTQLSNDETPDYCLLNEGQSCSMQGPVFAEIYEAAMQVVMHPQSNEQYRQKLFVLADLYTKQYPLDWPLLYQGGQPQRLAGLPAYPFNKQRYWFDLQLTTTPVSQVITSTARTMPTDLPGSVMHYLRGVFAEKLRTVPETIQVDETYEVYGVDSIIGLEITNRLEQDFGTLPKTLLYERNQIKDLAQYFIKQHKDKVATLITAVPAVDALPAITIEAPKANPMPVLLPQTSQDIAIIGLHGTFPMANTMDEFWDNLVHGRDCVGEVPADRWNYKDYPVQIGTEEKYFPHGGFIPDVDKFDPLFFNISPRDASFMDPQERLFMQSVWSTLEDAGYTREKLKVKTNNEVGVFAGVTYNFYPIFIAEEWQKGNRVPLDVQSFSVANRISYFLNLQGPSLVVDTACSSSLAAIHLACDSILRGDCRMAIAGGVNLSLHPSKYHFLGSFSFMSDVGRCTSFAEGGTGYVPSEGVGAVLLKPLAEAIADNDHIYGVIKASSMNHGGKTSGYTVPNPNAQADVILKTLNKAKIDARSISYIEAHGTGTALGDPIEVRGLQEAFEQFTEEKQYCAIGSVKSNLGHLESAAGISQLAKVLLQMQHKQLVPSIHAEKLNPFIDFANSPFYVQRELSAWQPTQQAPRRAGVSSFGAGGANVHMIIEEYVPAVKSQATTQGPFIFVLS
ncbi:MAG: KR domain-containing protein, partial [Legionella sp.]